MAAACVDDQPGQSLDRLRARIAGLQCPHCRNPLALVEDFSSLAPGRLHGVAACSCAEYPVAYNILNFGGKYDVGTREAIRSLRRGELAKAVAGQVQTEVVFPGHYWRAIRHLTKRHLMNEALLVRLRRLAIGNFSEVASFREGIDRLRSGTFGEYLVRRFALPWFFAGLPLCMLLKQLRPRHIVDLGCGSGHYQYVLSHLCPEADITAIDQHYGNLFLAQKFAASRNILYLCLNLGHPSPIRLPFDVLFTSDTLATLSVSRHGIRDYLAQLDPSGLVLAPRLDSAWSHPFGQSIQQWHDMFSSLPHRLYDENRLIDMVADTDGFDLSELERTQRLEDARAYFLIASATTPLTALTLRDYAALAVAAFPRWEVNPAYGPPIPTGDSVAFPLADHFPVHPREWEPVVRPRLPAELVLPAADLTGRTIHPNHPRLPDLVRGMVATLNSEFR